REAVFPALRGRPPRRRISRIAVYTGAALGASPTFQAEAERFARIAVESGAGIVYGGGRVGLMGAVANAAITAGGDVIGVMPESLLLGEIGHPDLATLEVVPDMHTRKARMAELADAFVALPGGAGTL